MLSEPIVRSIMSDLQDVLMPKMPNTALGSTTKKAMRYNDVLNFMRVELPFAELQEQYRHYLLYYIPFEAMALSSMFKAMAAVQKELNVSSYRITRTSLSEIYEKNSRQRQRYFIQKQSI